ncbi:MAG: hypothetical protein IJY82_02580 [Oscillospiraceae bacterium]|nr:hypothetical protein [Oscillospiraceae bacterium]
MEHFCNAQWIFCDAVSGPVVDRYFAYECCLNAPSGKAALYISAHSQYAVFLNGAFVNCGQYDDYEDYQVYDTLELDEYLQPGENELKIIQYVCGINTSTRSIQVPGVIFAAWDGDDQLLASGPFVLSGEDRRYHNGGELFTGQLGCNFSYDATLPDPVFAPSVPAGKEKHLFPRPIEKLKILPLETGKIVAQGIFLESDPTAPKSHRLQNAFLSSKRRQDLCGGDDFSWNLSASDRADGIYAVIDMGGEATGLLSVCVDVPQDTEILIGIGEHLDDLRVRSSIGGRNLACQYVAKAGHNEFLHPFQRFGLRYIQLHIGSSAGTLHWAGLRPTLYPLDFRPNPMKDRLHRRIWEVGCKTLQLCMHEHYEDCPWREQALYAMDSRVQILCGYYAFGEHQFPRAALSLMAKSLREDRLLELCAPGKVPVDIPAFTAVYLREVWEYTCFTGDQTLAEEVLPVLLKICNGFVERIDKTGLIPPYRGSGMWNFYEWQPGLSGYEAYSGKTYESPLCAFVADALRCLAQILRTLKTGDAARYEQIADDLCTATHRNFFHPETGGYLTRLDDEKPLHGLTQALMLFAGVAPKETEDRTAQLLVSNTLIPCSVSMTIYAYEALLQRGERYRDYVLSEIDRVWGRMLFRGADTFWETEIGADDFDYAGSLCHGWSAVPIYIFSHYHLP